MKDEEIEEMVRDQLSSTPMMEDAAIALAKWVRLETARACAEECDRAKHECERLRETSEFMRGCWDEARRLASAIRARFGVKP